MGLKAGIVGLPNVGKSTLFNAITKKHILVANYPFATIEPNVGIVTVPDIRMEKLEEMNEEEIRGIFEVMHPVNAICLLKGIIFNKNTLIEYLKKTLKRISEFLFYN